MSTTRSNFYSDSDGDYEYERVVAAAELGGGICGYELQKDSCDGGVT